LLLFPLLLLLLLLLLLYLEHAASLRVLSVEVGVLQVCYLLM
jgi:hypothetical protein